MSLSGVDYTKRLADKKSEFQRDVHDLRKGYRDNLSKLERANKHVQENASNNYDANLQKLQKNYEDRYDDVYDSSKEILANKQDLYRKRLEGQRDDFVARTEEQLGKFDRRLNDIRQSYNDSLDNETRQNADIRRNELERHRDQTDTLQNNHKEQIGELLESAVGTNLDLREQMVNRERVQQRNNDREMGDLRKKHTIATNKQNYSQSREMDKLREVTQKMVDSIDDDKRTTLKTMKRNQQNNINDIVDQYEDSARKAHDIREREKIENGRRMTEALSKQEKRNNEERFKEMVRSRGVSGSGSRIQDQVARSQIADMQGKVETRTNKLLNELKEREVINNARTHDAQVGYDQELQKRKIDNMNKLSEQEAQHNIYMTDKLGEGRSRQTELVKNYNSRYNDLKDDSSKMLADERLSGKRRLEIERTTNAKSMKFMTEQNSKALDDLLTNERKLRTEYFTKLQNDKTDMYNRVRDEFGNKLTTEQELRQEQVGRLNIDNDQLQDRVRDIKITERERGEGKLEVQKSLFAEQRKEDFRSMKELMRKREAKLRQQLNAQRLESDHKLYKVSQDNHQKVKELTDFYENKLDQMVRDFNLQIKRTDTQNSRDLGRLKFDWEENRKRLISQYETQIETIRANYELKLDKMARREDLT